MNSVSQASWVSKHEELLSTWSKLAIKYLAVCPAESKSPFSKTCGPFFISTLVAGATVHILPIQVKLVQLIGKIQIISGSPPNAYRWKIKGAAQNSYSQKPIWIPTATIWGNFEPISFPVGNGSDIVWLNRSPVLFGQHSHHWKDRGKALVKSGCHTAATKGIWTRSL